MHGGVPVGAPFSMFGVGAAHAYEDARSAILVAIFGAQFSLLAHV
jgi:hypothetical protein